MAYSVPTFNLPINIWRGTGALPPVGTPAVVTIGSLSPGRRVLITYDSVGITHNVLAGEILLPARTDVRTVLSVTGADTIECPAATGIYWYVMGVCDVGRNFSNEYRLALVRMVRTPTPMP